ncbi:aldose reductase-related protein 2-like [Condylostylus longicornis]|uniref:aldose reductase-related protein 2-like n=1 Tax=Condylostylus longicornis TaxID=2530218 RepID=UPI00244DBFEA|nr:aldose reductase-related protein 2-like [Condylostylus longicornis]
MTSERFFTLNNGLEMPSIGIGTFMAPDHEIETALDAALKAGYRHIDTAPVYLNEKAIGKALRRWIDTNQVKREDLFITTKLPIHANRPGDVEKTLKKSLEDLQLTYVDMYLIHAPVAVPQPASGAGSSLTYDRDSNGNLIIDPTTDHVKIWKKMEDMIEMGLTKNIGVSNFNQKQIQRLLDNSKIKPSNLQIELQVYFQQNDLVDFCKANNILITAYSPLGNRDMVKRRLAAGTLKEDIILFEDPTVVEIAKNHNKTGAQVLLRWILQRGICPIPKSTNPGRLQQNLDIYDFKLSDDEMNRLAGLDKGLRICDTSFFKGIEKHPECTW